MSFTEINDVQSFETLTKYINFGEKYKIIIKFGTEWCQPCLEMSKILEKIKEDNNFLLMYNINVENNEFSDIMVEYGIIKIPFLLVFKNNQLINKIDKLLSINEIKEIINM